MLTCNILVTEAEVLAIADEWRQLYALTHTSPLTDFDAFWSWWSLIGKNEDLELHITTGRRNGKLVALLPLVTGRRGGFRILREPGGVSAECDMMCDEPEDGLRLWQATKQSPRYDFGKITAIPHDSACCRALRTIARPRDPVEFFFLRFDQPTGKDWLEKSAGGEARRSYRRYMRRMEKRGTVEFKTYVGGTGPRPAHIVEDMVKLKTAWSEARDKKGLFEQSAVYKYFHEFTETAAQRGTLFLSWLVCGGVATAYNMGVIDQGILHLYFWTYDPAWAVDSPSTVLTVNMISWAVDHGLKGIDFTYNISSASEKFFKRKYCNEVNASSEFTFSGGLVGRVKESAFVTFRGLRRKIPVGKTEENDKPDAIPAPGPENDNTLPVSAE